MQNRIAISLGALALATTIAACSDSPVGPPSADQTSAIVDSRGSGSSGGTNASGTDARVETTLVATSTTFRNAKGKAKFRSRGGERELQIEVENLRPGVQVTFLLDGVALLCTGNVPCAATADGFGEARIELNSDGGPGVAGRVVPLSVSGRTVAASVGGETVVRGTFN